MKATLSLALALLTAASASAQLFRPEAVNGAVLGGVAGAIIGNNSGDLRHNAWKGAAIGAGTGLILGEAIGNVNAARRDTHAPAPGGYIHRQSPVVYASYSRSHGYQGFHRPHGHHRPLGHRGHFGHHRVYRPSAGFVYSYPYYGSYPYYSGSLYFGGYPYDGGYAYADGYPAYGYHGGSYGGSRAGTGLLLGALAGGVIGHNSGTFRHDAWRGAAWGAGVGWLLGAVSDANRRAARYESAPVVVPQAPVMHAQPAAQQAPQQVTITNNDYNAPASPMSQANALFGRD